MDRLRLIPRLPALVILLIAMPLAGPGHAQTRETLAGTPHDFSEVAGSVEEGCAMCHFPFATSGNKGGTDAAEAYSPILAIDGSAGMGMETALCLSCHDGLSGPSVGSYDGSHPSSVMYDPLSASVLRPVSEVEERGLRLAGEAGERRVECTSCHTAHDNANGSFLRISNGGSVLCLTCHVK